MTDAQTVSLIDTDAEITAVASLLYSYENFGLFADDLKPEWFTDELMRFAVETAIDLHGKGIPPSPVAISGMLPSKISEQVSARDLVMSVVKNQSPIGAIPGLLHTVKDRWARRELKRLATDTNDVAALYHQDPFILAADIAGRVDIVSSVRRRNTTHTAHQAAMSLMDDIRTGNDLFGATTGIARLDNALSGYKRGQLYVFGGRPGMGKSAFAVSSLRRTAESGSGVMLFSLEMDAKDCMARLISDALDSEGAPHFSAIMRGDIADQWTSRVAEAVSETHKLPLKIDDASSLTMSEIRNRATLYKNELEQDGMSLDVVCIDHLHLVASSDRYKGTRVMEVAEISNAARQMAKDLDCCVVLLCQLNRATEHRDDKRPSLADLRWSGEVEQDAHVVAFLYREEYYLKQQADADPMAMLAARNRMDFLIRKNRNGESPTDINLRCSIAHSSVRDD